MVQNTKVKRKDIKLCRPTGENVIKADINTIIDIK